MRFSPLFLGLSVLQVNSAEMDRCIQFMDCKKVQSLFDGKPRDPRLQYPLSLSGTEWFALLSLFHPRAADQLYSTFA